MFGRKSGKATHVLSAADGSTSVTGSGSGIAVYGRKDLKRRTDAARELGVPVTVRKLKRNER